MSRQVHILVRSPADIDDDGTAVPAGEWEPLGEAVDLAVWEELRRDMKYRCSGIYSDHAGNDYKAV
jgi:hypothetical protein